MDEIEALKVKLDAMTPEQRTQLKAEVRDAWARDEAAAREKAIEAKREHERGLLAARHNAATAIIATVESMRPMLAEFHQANNALRQVLPLPQQPHLLDFRLADGIAQLDVDHARAEVATCKHAAELIVARGRQ